MSKEMGKGSGIFSLISELVPRGMSEHVRMDRELQPCGLTGPLDHPQKPSSRNWSSAFSNEDVGTIAL
jgi:hypothetical protein